MLLCTYIYIYISPDTEAQFSIADPRQLRVARLRSFETAKFLRSFESFIDSRSFEPLNRLSFVFVPASAEAQLCVASATFGSARA